MILVAFISSWARKSLSSSLIKTFYYTHALLLYTLHYMFLISLVHHKRLFNYSIDYETLNAKHLVWVCCYSHHTKHHKYGPPRSWRFKIVGHYFILKVCINVIQITHNELDAITKLDTKISLPSAIFYKFCTNSNMRLIHMLDPKKCYNHKVIHNWFI